MLEMWGLILPFEKNMCSCEKYACFHCIKFLTLLLNIILFVIVTGHSLSYGKACIQKYANPMMNSSISSCNLFLPYIFKTAIVANIYMFLVNFTLC